MRNKNLESIKRRVVERKQGLDRKGCKEKEGRIKWNKSYKRRENKIE